MQSCVPPASSHRLMLSTVSSSVAPIGDDELCPPYNLHRGEVAGEGVGGLFVDGVGGQVVTRMHHAPHARPCEMQQVPDDDRGDVVFRPKEREERKVLLRVTPEMKCETLAPLEQAHS